MDSFELHKKGVVGIDNRKFAKNVKKATLGDAENCALVETDHSGIVNLPYSSVAGSEPTCSAMLSISTMYIF